jgi:gliding motility-associated-like protein
VNQAAGEITLMWQSDVPVTFAQIETITELVFTSKEAGTGQLEWYATATESYFIDASGTPIPAEFYAGLVEIYDPPVILLESPINACEGQTVTIPGIAHGLNPPLTYEWIYPNGQTDSVQPYFSSVTLADAGYYTLLVTDALGCTDQESVYLSVSAIPVAAFHGSDTLTVPRGFILEAGSGMASYLWNTGAITESIKIIAEGMYIVELESWAGCIGIDSVYILFAPPECFYIPNAFTPNGDGLNDIFKPVTFCPVTDYHMLIYNRWGEKLFESNDISTGWDGRKNGNLCPGDTYVYMISYKVEETQGAAAKNVKYGIVLLLK